MTQRSSCAPPETPNPSLKLTRYRRQSSSNVRRHRMQHLRMWYRLSATASALLVIAKLAHSQAADPISQMAWLAGCWAAEGKESGSGEMWLYPAGGTMLGVSRTVRSGQTLDFEFMQIRTNAQGQLVFVALPSGQREATFVVSSVSPTEASFENQSHDFPQKVIYRNPEPGRLVARIEGMRDGEIQAIEFPMRKVSCEQQRQGAPQ